MISFNKNKKEDIFYKPKYRLFPDKLGTYTLERLKIDYTYKGVVCFSYEKIEDEVSERKARVLIESLERETIYIDIDNKK